MALSRRPARFERRHSSMPSPSTAISQQKLHLLRAAAARVYINNQEEEAKNNTTNKEAAGGPQVEEEAEDPEHGVKLLAAAALQRLAQPRTP